MNLAKLCDALEGEAAEALERARRDGMLTIAYAAREYVFAARMLGRADALHDQPAPHAARVALKSWRRARIELRLAGSASTAAGP